MKSAVIATNNKLKFALVFFILISLGVLGGGWYYAFSFKKQLAKTATEVKFLEEESMKKTEVVQRYNRISDYSSVVNDSLPNTKEVSSFLASVEELAIKNKLKITSSSISAPNTKTKKQTDLELSQTTNLGGYYELQIKYSMEGSYLSFLQMLNDLKVLRRLNSISEISIVKNTTEVTNDRVQVTFTDSIYIKK